MRENYELQAAWFTVFLLGAAYAVYTRFSTPSPGAPVGHTLGVIGTLLMLATETLYSIRKRTNWLQFGRLRTWLSLHIYMGIVGPTMVLMHTAWKFHGLAGLTMLLTAVVVISGFFGRYIYTAVPRTMSGATVEYQQLAAQLNRLSEQLQSWLAQEPPHVRELIQRVTGGRRSLAAVGAASGGSVRRVLIRAWDDWNYRRQVYQVLSQVDTVDQSQLREIGRLLQRRHRLERQAASLTTARKLLGQWRIAHVPMGTALFTAVALHVAAALLFSTLAR